MRPLSRTARKMNCVQVFSRVVPNARCACNVDFAKEFPYILDGQKNFGQTRDSPIPKKSLYAQWC
jgi:hypothetical protein